METKQPFFTKYRLVPLVFAVICWLFVLAIFLSFPFNWLRFGNLFIIPISMSTALWKMYGHPRNWWVSYFGGTVHIDTFKLIRQRGFGYLDSVDSRWAALDEEIDQWMEEVSIKRYYRHWSGHYQFLRKKDAVYFKLFWG